MTIFRLLQGSNHPFWRFQLSPFWAPGNCLLGIYLGMKKLSSYNGASFHKPWNQDPVIKQPGWLMESFRDAPFFISSRQKSVDGWCESMGIWTSKKNLRVSSLSEVADLSPQKRFERKLFSPQMVPKRSKLMGVSPGALAAPRFRAPKSTTLNWVVATQIFLDFSPLFGEDFQFD